MRAPPTGQAATTGVGDGSWFPLPSSLSQLRVLRVVTLPVGNANDQSLPNHVTHAGPIRGSVGAPRPPFQDVGYRRFGYPGDAHRAFRCRYALHGRVRLKDLYLVRSVVCRVLDLASQAQFHAGVDANQVPSVLGDGQAGRGRNPVRHSPFQLIAHGPRACPGQRVGHAR